MQTGVILAAGKGTRMQSKQPKVLHKVLDKSMIEHVIDSLKIADVEQIIIVLGHEAEMVQAALSHIEGLQFVLQDEQLGTAHAFEQTKPLIDGTPGNTIVVYGDTPLLTGETIKHVFTQHEQTGAACTVLTGVLDDATGYGRIVRDAQGVVVRIVEQKDANAEEQAIQEFNSGTYCFKNEQLFERVASIEANNAQGEYYLTDMVEILNAAGELVNGTIVNDIAEVSGVNDRVALEEVTKFMQKRINQKHQLAGASIIDVQATYIGADVVIGRDVVIEPNVQIYGKSIIGDDVFIGMNSTIIDTEIGDGTRVEQSHLTDTSIGKNTTVGPFARMRGNCTIGDEVRVGNFVEMKHTTIGNNTNVAHLSYLGDAEIGERTNIGCGTVTVNYDGFSKFKTVIGNDVFIGCNTHLVAPITVEDNAMTAAGSTISDTVTEHSMAIARVKQTNKLGYARVFRTKNKK